ncbi:uncharacterized protein LOC129963302 isoform X2 [Argiope bruennichi]|nr:uncharacterized protein LOC129963302 isoform X2 [Argiope bruennichi]
MKARFHCSVPGCLYFTGSERFFTEKKFLNQHIAKVHAEKKYSCSKCTKCFGLDSLRKLHEKTCGIEWKCTCGVKYSSRESLLTHARRTQHKLPDHIINPDKMKQSKNTGLNTNPIILFIQPIIQNLTCIQPARTSSLTRPILPKTLQHHILTVPSSISDVKNMCNLVYSSPPSEKFAYNNISPNSISDSLSNQFLSSSYSTIVNNNNDNNSNNNLPKLALVDSATQTSSDFEILKRKESRASQCSRRKSKSAAVGIESTHTQTAESTVVKIKRKKSRRKSVAVTTESSTLTGDESNAGLSLWPNFKDLIFSENSGNRAFRNSTSTQTSNNKILCDSQTITDDELFKLVWDNAENRKDSNDCCNSPFGMLQDIAVDDSLSAISEGLSADALNMFASNSSVVDSVLSQDIKIKDEPGNDMILPTDSVNKGMANESCSVFPDFSECVKQDMNNKVMDIYTQTMASNVLDYNLLANMETQTTDDFSLYDLEFLDTETQTPWEDFPNIDDSPVPADQLSIEIQTDFSSEMDQDPYDFINSLNVQSMINDCSTKESFGVNSETQTHDWSDLTQFTNSESQTLDLANLFFSK